MKLTSKEITILSVFLSIVIIVAGLFLFILPEYEKIEPNKASLESAKNQKDQIYRSLSREGTIDQEIQDAIDQANDISKCFYDDMTTYEADVVVRQLLEEGGITVSSLSLGSFSTTTLTVSDYIKTVVTYPLKEYSGYTEKTVDTSNLSMEFDEEGELIIPEDFQELYGEHAKQEFMVAYLTTQQQTIGAITANFTINCTRGEFLDFIDYIAGLEKATSIGGISIAYTASTGGNTGSSTLTGGQEGRAAVNENADANVDADNNTDTDTGDDANENTNTNTNNGEQTLNNNSEVSMGISLTLYCVKPMTMDDITAEEGSGTEGESAE